MDGKQIRAAIYILNIPEDFDKFTFTKLTLLSKT